MRTVVIITAVLTLGFTIDVATQPPPTEKQIQAERQAQAEKLGALAEITDLIINITTFDGKVAKSDMRQLQKLVDKYKDIPFYKEMKKKLDPETIPSLYLLTTVERITELYFPSLGHTCEKECLMQITALFDRLGADVKTVEPNTGPRDILIGAIVGTIAAIFFVAWLFRRVCFLGELKERMDKEKTST